MTLEDVMAADADTIFNNTDEFAKTFDFYPGERDTDDDSVPITAVCGDMSVEVEETRRGEERISRLPIQGVYSDISAAIATVSGVAAAREPVSGDRLVRTSQPYIGEWWVEEAVTEDGDTVSIILTRQVTHRVQPRSDG